MASLPVFEVRVSPDGEVSGQPREADHDRLAGAAGQGARAGVDGVRLVASSDGLRVDVGGLSG